MSVNQVQYETRYWKDPFWVISPGCRGSDIRSLPFLTLALNIKRFGGGSLVEVKGTENKG